MPYKKSMSSSFIDDEYELQNMRRPAMTSSTSFPRRKDMYQMRLVSDSQGVDGDPTISQRVEEQYVTSSIFTGGSNSMTRAHLMDKMIDSKPSHPQMAGAKGSRCAVPDCDGMVMIDERGQDLLPCECGYVICNDCYHDELVVRGVCKGCGEPYKKVKQDASGLSKTERKMSMMKSVASSHLTRSQIGDFDLDLLQSESNETYGYGNAVNAMRSIEGSSGDGDQLDVEESENLIQKPYRPLTRKIEIRPALLIPYRIVTLVRMVALGCFLVWRVSHPNEDAPWLWSMSIVCEIWFAFAWILDQFPKLFPIDRTTDLSVLQEKFEKDRPPGKSDLPRIDVLVSTADPGKEPPLVTANTILSILAADYPVEKLSCYVSDDGGALLTFEAMAEAASFASVWVPFCRKHSIDPRNPESYFNLKRDPFNKSKLRHDFVKDRRRVKREYDEFKVRINALPDSIRRRSDAFHAQVEMKALKHWKQTPIEEQEEVIWIPRATWMADKTHWPGTWVKPTPDHSRGDHAGIIQVMLKPPSEEPLMLTESYGTIDFKDVDIQLPMLVYVSREKRPDYEHNKKAGAMNALLRASAIMSNGPFVLNLDCDHYVYNSRALREGICFMMDHGGDSIGYVQFPQRFEGVDPSDRYANNNTVFFDVNMRALDGLQGPVYVGTGCLFRRTALYGFNPPWFKDRNCNFFSSCFQRHKMDDNKDENLGHCRGNYHEANVLLHPKKVGNSELLIESIRMAGYKGLSLVDSPYVNSGTEGAPAIHKPLLHERIVAEAIDVISCWYEDKTEWGKSLGWIYGSVTEDVVTGYQMHNRGWNSVYCSVKPDAFRGTAPINLTDRLHQVLRWATGAVEIFFSRNNALLASSKMNFLQKIAYFSNGIYPFTSFFLITYCFLPALSLFSGQFIVQAIDVNFLFYLLLISTTLTALAVLEIKWSNINLEEWWRNEQFWLIGGTSAHLTAVLQGLLKTIAGIEISFNLTSKPSTDDGDDEFADLYIVKWTSLMIPPIVIIVINLIAIAVGFSRTIYSTTPQWSSLVGGVFFSFWVLAHLYPFVKGLMGKRGRTPTIAVLWSILIAIIISLLWVTVNPPSNSDPTGLSFLP
ncbi:Cellulose synthase-like protein [Drosera capensis]